jgi:SAM-dependent methyltransferase
MMDDAAGTDLYENPALLSVTGGVLRPGGMDLTRRVMASCGLPPDARVIDVGCGSGATVECLRREFGLAACGVDVERRFGRAAENSRPLAQAHVLRLPVRSGAVSAVVCECVLSLLPDPDAAVTEFRRVLVDGGRLVVTDMYVRAQDRTGELNSLPPASCLKGALPRHAIELRLKRHGFHVLAWEDHSPALKRLAAQLVFACGSLKAFWSAAGACGAADPSGVRHARPGYFACVARKEGRP